MDAFYKNPFRKLINLLGPLRSARLKEPPIFIGGCGRSGTTLLLSILSAHPDLFCHPKELGIFNNAKIRPDGSLKVPRIHRLNGSFLFNKIPQSAKRWVEKSPSNIRCIHSIEAFTNNNFKFIEIIRDGRDVILSKHPTDPGRYWVDPSRWIRDVSAGLPYENDPRVHTIRYEDLINDYERVMQGICEHLDIEFTDELRNWHEHARVRENRAYFGQVQKISSVSVEKWRKPEFAARVGQLMSEPEAGKLLERYGYPLD